MPFVEVFAPRGALREEQRTRLSEELVAEVMQVEGAPDTAAARSISWLVFHDVEAWSVGGLAVAADEPARYLVRVSVPAGSLDDGKRDEMMRRVTAVLAKADDDPDRLYTEPSAWVHIVEIPDGNWGAFGRVVRLPDIVNFVLGQPS
ncbi:tautomerase family protein [Nonomuraea basaltis]|uniref:tautomerase family protein n=1 Tax=Nonomuraea basaltis TaxID=2495887 RepID=UPI00110C6560|nr:tautomerase family protein [Nonomuraea basaltis]TMR96461.1 4-oxalocrotonate tautomerase [Nonomuraea basaltis]